MLPSSIMTFWSFTQQPSTPLSVLVARATAWLIASSKLVSEIALNSVTRATLIASASLHSSLPDLVARLICGPAARTPNIKTGHPVGYPARKCRAMGRIEHPLLDRGRSSAPSDLRPSLAPPLYHTKLQMFLFAQKIGARSVG